MRAVCACSALAAVCGWGIGIYQLRWRVAAGGERQAGRQPAAPREASDSTMRWRRWSRPICLLLLLVLQLLLLLVLLVLLLLLVVQLLLRLRLCHARPHGTIVTLPVRRRRRR